MQRRVDSVDCEEDEESQQQEEDLSGWKTRFPWLSEQVNQPCQSAKVHTRAADAQGHLLADEKEGVVCDAMANRISNGVQFPPKASRGPSQPKNEQSNERQEKKDLENR